LEEPQKTAISFFNFAHSYAASALALCKVDVKATHPSSPVSFLFFHAIELYLKAYLLRQGLTEETLRKRDYGHNTMSLANAAEDNALILTDADKEVISHLSGTDNIIASRYIRLGYHSRLPMDTLHETCFRLHSAIGPQVYEGSGVSRIPVLEPGPLSKLEKMDIQKAGGNC
jgi:hypothetical protein